MNIVLAIVQNKNKILIIQRAKSDKEVPDLIWAFPGGKVKSSERIEQALIREVYEETGLRVTIDRMVHTRVIPDTNITANYFLCSLASVSENKVKINSEEIKAFDWVTGVEALDKFTSDVSKPISQLLQNIN